MSVNYNRAKYNKALDNKEYNQMMKNEWLYCPICVRRGGSYESSCAPGAFRKRGARWRMNRTWKHNRKQQYKC